MQIRRILSTIYVNGYTYKNGLEKMADVHEPHVRSYNMSRIKSKDSKPELLVRKYIHSKGLRFRLHAQELPGRPDMVLKKYKTAIFVHGCFWHGHRNCNYAVVPKTNTEFWLNKISSNKKRDKARRAELKKLGWKVLEIWECAIKSYRQEKTLARVLKKIVA